MAAAATFDLETLLKRESGLAPPVLATAHGALFNEDCLAVLPGIGDAVVDTLFADPPFNIGKVYGARVDDRRRDDDYLAWSERWLDECVRVLRPGGSLFIYNLPRWNILLGAHLIKRGLELRHWIAVDMRATLPIPNRLYPAHYGLLYFTKGKPKTFRKIRTPIATCRHCNRELKDYGGHRAKMNAHGVNLTDVWTDIAPVRHPKFKSGKRAANQLSAKLLWRVIELSTEPGDLVLDPFGGSGTTFDVAEQLHRRWLGIEIESCEAIIERLSHPGRVAWHTIADHVAA